MGVCTFASSPSTASLKMYLEFVEGLSMRVAVDQCLKCFLFNNIIEVIERLEAMAREPLHLICTLAVPSGVLRFAVH